MDDSQALREEVRALREKVARNENLLLVLTAVVIAAVTFGVMSFWLPPGPIDVSEVRVVTWDGHLRARLGVNGLGDTELTLADAQGRERLWLKAGEQHGTFEITDAERRVQVRLSAIENLSGLHLAHGSRSAQVTASSETTSVTLVDLDDSLSAVLRAEPDGTDLQLSRNKTGEPPRLASLSAGGADPEKGASVTIAGPQQFLQGTVHPSDGEPRLVIAGETRVESRTGADEAPWQRFERAPEPTLPR